ncbi:MAG: glucokinase [Patescibacteria group bacterium]|nr:glucokinase [Patescibacteria group bacterium]
MKKENFYIGIDIGGTHARITSFSSLKELEFKGTKIITLTHNFENDFNEILKTVKSIKSKDITAIGVGLPGVLNEEKNLLISATNIPEWVNFDIKSKLIQIFQCRVFLENDAVTSALGEALYGGVQTEDFIYMIWGTGIGGATVELKPTLKVQKLSAESYITDLRHSLYGKFLLEKYNKPLRELESEEWNEVMFNFSKLIIHISDNFKIKNIIIAGGIALKQKARLELLAKKLKEENNINLRTTNLGDHHTFGLYGVAGFLATIMEFE